MSFDPSLSPAALSSKPEGMIAAAGAAGCAMAVAMTSRILVFYGSYRSDRLGIRLAQFVVDGLRGRGDEVELIDARAVGLPMLDRMYKEYPKGQAPARTGRPRWDASRASAGWRR